METEETEAYDEEVIEHIGIKRRSGRYPWGSGKDPYQRAVGFKAYVDDLKAKGFTDSEIAESLSTPKHPFKTTDLRAGIAISTEEIHTRNVMQAVKLKEKQLSNTAIGKVMGGENGPIRESTVRGWLKSYEDNKQSALRTTAESLKAELEKAAESGSPFVDVGKGTHLYMGISDTKLRTALAMLRDEGYEVYPVKMPQLGTDLPTTHRVITKEGVSFKEARDAVYEGRVKIPGMQTDDGGLTYRMPKDKPVSVDLKRVGVKWAEEGGTEMDGVIELRRGVEDLSLGKSKYAQVRVAVDGTHYLKGMAMYADDLPDGVDIRFNTNKSKSSNKLDAMKPMKTTKDGEIDADHPFGATTHRRVYIDKKGKERTSPLEIVNEEGQWDKWSKSLSSQMLSKQSLSLADTQLGVARKAREDDLDEILSLTNPVVKKKLLEDFADNADSAAVHLKAAALPRQATKVLLPMNSIRPHEVYAPDFDSGEKVVLVRHPHGGPFEIPELTVNNSNRQALRIMKGAKDAIGIHHSVAAQLSGADFDGDTVVVIPNRGRKIKTDKPWKELQEFEPKVSYKIPDGDTKTPRMTKRNTQTEMGKISNLITDMSIHNASREELIKAVRHSMVVIDAEKHGLNYKQSEIDNSIKLLKQKYQGKANAGAATIISRASSPDAVPHRKRISGDRGIDPKTGEKLFVLTGETYVNKAGKTVVKKTHGTKMEFVSDARKLMSKDPQPMEEIYAAHANSMKALANRARKVSVSIKPPKQSAIAKRLYASEVESLNEKLKTAYRNKPLERKAQSIGRAKANARIEDDPSLDNDDIKRIKYQSLEEARVQVGANKYKIGAKDASGNSTLTRREWEAIQAGAVSSTMLREILANADMDRVRELATPRARTALTPGQLARARQMEATGRSTSEIAAELGLPRSTVADNLAAG